MVPSVITERIEALENLIEKHPLKIPLSAAADFLGMNTDGLMAALMRGNTPFGFAYQKQDGGNRVAVIPTATFYMWFTNINGMCVRTHDLPKEGRVS